mgnify:FL=1
MKMPVSRPRAKCEQVLREVAATCAVKVTNRGKAIAVVSSAKPEIKPDPKEFWGSFKGTVTYISTDFDEPLGDEEIPVCHHVKTLEAKR